MKMGPTFIRIHTRTESVFAHSKSEWSWVSSECRLKWNLLFLLIPNQNRIGLHRFWTRKKLDFSAFAYRFCLNMIWSLLLLQTASRIASNKSLRSGHQSLLIRITSINFAHSCHQYRTRTCVFQYQSRTFVLSVSTSHFGTIRIDLTDFWTIARKDSSTQNLQSLDDDNKNGKIAPQNDKKEIIFQNRRERLISLDEIEYIVCHTKRTITPKGHDCSSRWWYSSRWIIKTKGHYASLRMSSNDRPFCQNKRWRPMQNIQKLLIAHACSPVSQSFASIVFCGKKIRDRGVQLSKA